MSLDTSNEGILVLPNGERLLHWPNLVGLHWMPHELESGEKVVICDSKTYEDTVRLLK